MVKWERPQDKTYIFLQFEIAIDVSCTATRTPKEPIDFFTKCPSTPISSTPLFRWHLQIPKYRIQTTLNHPLWMEAIRKQATKLREQVAKQQQVPSKILTLNSDPFRSKFFIFLFIISISLMASNFFSPLVSHLWKFLWYLCCFSGLDSLQSWKRNNSNNRNQRLDWFVQICSENIKALGWFRRIEAMFMMYLVSDWISYLVFQFLEIAFMLSVVLYINLIETWLGYSIDFRLLDISLKRIWF